ncbi:outer membrane beta-barrel protein [Aquidulcibacter sp.]|uniref:outer membrane protein n=1 Tax=Aquidulcibacter sp. TaxID=2052990 RepID=UPI0025C1048F|nr:outer membrane beta-barrel protein [Aquidulcibacter sp.]MCA3697692.1 porin family protein [Aquidulcibacter sp.]
MHRVLLAASAAITLCFSAGSALAQDGGGLYGGIVIGTHNDTDVTVNTVGTTAFRNLGPTIVPNQLKPTIDGVTYGVIMGNSFRGEGPIMWGWEIDLVGGGDSQTASFSGALIAGIAPTGLTTSASKEYGIRASLRGRLGASFNDRIFVYGTGGLAIAQVETKASVAVNGAPTLLWAGSNSENLTGWAIGVGAELRILEGATLRGEYIYTDLGKGTVTAVGNAAVRQNLALTGIDYAARTDYKGGEVRAGLLFNY